MKRESISLGVLLAVSVELLFCLLPLHNAYAEPSKQKHVMIPSDCGVDQKGKIPTPTNPSPEASKIDSSFAPVVGKIAAMHVDCNSELLKGTVLSNFHVSNHGKEVYLDPRHPARVFNPWSKSLDRSNVIDFDSLGDWGDWVIAYTVKANDVWLPIANGDEQITLHIELQRNGSVSTIKTPGVLDEKRKQLVDRLRQLHASRWPLSEAYYKGPPLKNVSVSPECRDYDRISFDLTVGSNRRKFPMGDTLQTRMAVVRDSDGTDYWLNGLDDRRVYHGPNGSCMATWSYGKNSKRHTAFQFAPGEFDAVVKKIALGQSLSGFWSDYKDKHEVHE